jgi:uncharacterized membrane protein
MNKVNLNYWHLGSILGSALGLPAMIIGGQVSSLYGVGAGITSVFIGNVILWAIGMGIISMGKTENHTIQNVINYLGRGGGIIVSVVIVISFLLWYAIQLSAAEKTLTSIASISKIWNTSFAVSVGVPLGLICSFISAWNIRLIKWLCTIALPILLIYVVFKTIESLTTNPISLNGGWKVSFPGILFIMTSWIPGAINLSTFFRHAKSVEDKVLGLSLMTLFHIIFQLVAIFCCLNNLSSIFVEVHSNFQQMLAMGFVILSFFCINLTNIYFASVGWETFIKGPSNVLNYIATGLAGTILYLFLPGVQWFAQVEISIAAFITTLGIALLLMFIMNDVVKPDFPLNARMEKLTAALCWLIGCFVSIISQFFSTDSCYPIIFGVLATIISFLVIIFLKNTIESIRIIIKSKNSPTSKMNNHE